MNRTGHEAVVFFVGPEVEHTPAFCKKTLFVVGTPLVANILAQAQSNNTPHVFMGANHSFDITNQTYWSETISKLLDHGYWVTLDYPAHEHNIVLEMLAPSTWVSRKFVPLLSVRIPHIETSSANLTVKIDDIDFKATNPGVWCMHYTEVTDSNRFTGWQEYESDTIAGDPADIPTGSIRAKEVAPVTPNIPVTLAPIASTPTINNTDIGIDVDSKSLLKPEPVEVTKPALKVQEVQPPVVEDVKEAKPAAVNETKPLAATPKPKVGK